MSLRTWMKFSRRVRDAANQMYQHVQAGRTFEVPHGPGTDDLTTRAVLCLRQMHPEVPLVFQARTVIIGRVDKTAKVSGAAWDQLKKGNYLPEAQLAHNPEAFLAEQAAFIQGQGLDRSEEIKEGQRRQAERDRIVMSGGNAIDAERTAVKVEREATIDKAIESTLNELQAEGAGASNAGGTSK